MVRAGSTNTAGMPSRRELRAHFDPDTLSRGLARYSGRLRWSLLLAFVAYVLLGGLFAYWWTLWSVGIVIVLLAVLFIVAHYALRPVRDPLRPVIDPLKNRIDRWAIIPWVGFAVSIVLVSLRSNALEAGGAGLWALVPLGFLLLTLLPDALFVRALNRMSADAGRSPSATR